MSSGQIQCFGASTDIAFRQDVASQESLAPLFTAFQSDEASASSAEQSEEAAKSKDASNDEQFAGDNVSPDLRELIDGRNSPSHVKALLQVNDANSATLRQQLGALGVSIDAQMPRFGILAVDLPTKAVEKLASNSQTRYLSLDRSVVASGHIENTTGEATMWSQSGNSGFAGSGVGIAILDSGITKMGGLDNIVLNQDFTGEGITTTLWAWYFRRFDGRREQRIYGGTAPDAKIINFRVLNSQGNGTLSGVLAALNAVLANKAKYNIRVVNLSLGMDAVDSYKNDPLCRAVRSLSTRALLSSRPQEMTARTPTTRRFMGEFILPK
jgi:serine protease AprX